MASHCSKARRLSIARTGRLASSTIRRTTGAWTNGCQRRTLPELSLEAFQSAIDLAVRENLGYLPPYVSGCSLCMRPLLYGSSVQIALHPATEAVCRVMVAPVGTYYKGGTLTPARGTTVEDFDRAAPRVSAIARYWGIPLLTWQPESTRRSGASQSGCTWTRRSVRLIEVFNTSNFVAIVGNKYATPLYDRILPSVTNKSLAELVKDMGLEV